MDRKWGAAGIKKQQIYCYCLNLACVRHSIEQEAPKNLKVTEQAIRRTLENKKRAPELMFMQV